MQGEDDCGDANKKSHTTIKKCVHRFMRPPAYVELMEVWFNCSTVVATAGDESPEGAHSAGAHSGPERKLRRELYAANEVTPEASNSSNRRCRGPGMDQAGE